MSDPNMLRFDSYLISCVESGNNDVAKKLLQHKLHEIRDILGLLLHRAALGDNDEITEYLLEMGCDVNQLDYYGKTPLMIAVEAKSTDTVKVLLEANANIDIVIDNGNSILELIFSSLQSVEEGILVLFFQRLQRDSPNVKDLLERIFTAGSTMYHAAFSRDITVMEGMLKRGIDINSRGFCGVTALHAAVALNDLDLAKWLLNNNAEVDALDDEGGSPLHDAAYHGRADLLRLLLEHGANPNITEYRYDYTPLFTAFSYSLGEADQERFDECIELLIQYGAIPRNSNNDRNTLFDYSVFTKSNNRINLLIARLAMLERLGTPIVKSVLYYNKQEHLKFQRQLEENYKLCWELLGLIIYRKITLFNLLTESDDNLRIHVRDQDFLLKINYVNHKLAEAYNYYFEPLMKRIGEAVRIVNMEDKAIPIVCALMGGHYNQCYDFVRIIVAYLDAEDLEQLCRVSEF